MIGTWPDSGGAAGGEDTGQYLCFWLGKQTYAMPVSEVHEIRAAAVWRELPWSPPWVLGVMNLRGLVIPLCDLRVRLAIA